MRGVTALLVVLFVIAGYEAAVPYFSRVRDLTHIDPGRQNYFVVDPDIWKVARPDLADLRVYDGQSQVPFVLTKESGDSSRQDSTAKILNLGTVSGHTEFDLDVRSIPEYSRVRLGLDAKNFICTAHVQGRRNTNDHSGTELGSSTLYDFTAEGLGSNFTLKIPASSFPYLHVRLASGIRPEQVKGASIASFSETKPAWLPAGNCVAVSGPPKQSVFDCAISEGMPVERFAFEVESAAVNFNRTVIVSDDKGEEVERGSISRVQMTRAGQTVTSEDLAIESYPRTARSFRVAIANGDDAPLPVQQVRVLSVERRIYFDPADKTALRLYYGDPKLEAPSYDYAKFFRADAEAAIAQLGLPEANPQFTGRPDDRPWSERHRGVLWVAMLIAVAVLGSLALRGLRSNKEGPSR